MNNYKTKKILTNFFSILFLLSPLLTLAQSTNTPNPPSTNTPNPPSSVTGPIQIENPFNCGPNCTLPDFIKKVLNDIVLPIGGVISVLMIVYSGFLFVTAQGNESKITKAKDALLYACIGAAILLGAIVISQAIGGTINQLKA